MGVTTWRPPVKPPVGAAQIDWGHPLARGHVATMLFNEGAGPIHLIGRIPSQAPLASGDSWTASRYGLAVQGVYSAAPEMRFGTQYGPFFAATNDVTVFALAQLDGITLGHGLIDQTGAGDATNNAWWLGNESSNFEFRVNAGGIGTATKASDTAWHSLAGVYDHATKVVRILVDAVGGTDSSTATGTLNDVSGNLLIGNLGSGIDYDWSGQIALIHCFNAPKPDAEIAWLHAEPYAFLRPVVRRRYLVAPGGGAAGLGWKLVGPPARLAGPGGLAA